MFKTLAGLRVGALTVAVGGATLGAHAQDYNPTLQFNSADALVIMDGNVAFTAGHALSSWLSVSQGSFSTTAGAPVTTQVVSTTTGGRSVRYIAPSSTLAIGTLTVNDTWSAPKSYTLRDGIVLSATEASVNASLGQAGGSATIDHLRIELGDVAAGKLSAQVFGEVSGATTTGQVVRYSGLIFDARILGQTTTPIGLAPWTTSLGALQITTPALDALSRSFGVDAGGVGAASLQASLADWGSMVITSRGYKKALDDGPNQFPYWNQYKPAANVPEPSTWLMMGLGLAAVGAAASASRRRATMGA